MKRSILSIFLLVFLLSPITNFAKTFTFSPPDDAQGAPVFVGDWSESSNWTSPYDALQFHILPQAGDIIIILEDFTANINENIDLTSDESNTHTLVQIYGRLNFTRNSVKLYIGSRNDCQSNVIVYNTGYITALDNETQTKGNGNGNGNGNETNNSNKIILCETNVWNSKFGPNGPHNFNEDSSLPIELTSFKAYAKGTAVEIFWSTASEINNDFFSVERSLNGIDFEVIAEVIAAGNSNTSLNYSFTDEKPYKETAYYRLKQTDFNLDFTYSKLVVVKNEGSKEQIFKVYPNPVNKSESINLFITGENSGDIKISVYNAYGRMVFSETLNNAANTEVPLDFHNAIPKGTYFIIFVSNNEVYKQKLIINE